MIAHLPMYDVPENKGAHDRLWAALKDHYIDLPERGIARDAWADWQSPKLVLSQTCGLPYHAKLKGKVNLVGVPDNKLPGCAPGQYRSAIVVRADTNLDLRSNDFVLAVNENLSQSGWGAPFAAGIIGKSRMITGSHRASAKAVVDGKADAASLDALTWFFLQRDHPEMKTLKVLQWTRPTPTLPFITSVGRDPNALFDAMSMAISDVGTKDRKQLSLYGILPVTSKTYETLSVPPTP